MLSLWSPPTPSLRKLTIIIIKQPLLKASSTCQCKEVLKEGILLLRLRARMLGRQPKAEPFSSLQRISKGYETAPTTAKQNQVNSQKPALTCSY